MLKKILVALVVVIAAVLLFAATRPDTFRIERSTTISAPPAQVFALLEDFHRWPEWSPWEKMDPAMQRSHSGPASGPGASYAWKGNSKVGSGSMKIVDSSPPQALKVQLDFIEPFEGHNIADFTLAPAGGSTRVSWVMHGPSPYVSKVLGVFVSMDSLIGKDFEAGLANLKQAAEKK